MKNDGNCPLFRAEVAYTQTIGNGVITFGGCQTMLNNWNKEEENPKDYVHFGDCHEYLSKQRKWIMIQSEIHPSHRAYAGMCIGERNNILYLYGGFYFDTRSDCSVHGDFWMLD